MSPALAGENECENEEKQSDKRRSLPRLRNCFSLCFVAPPGQISNFLCKEKGLLMLDTVIVLEATGFGGE